MSETRKSVVRAKFIPRIFQTRQMRRKTEYFVLHYSKIYWCTYLFFRQPRQSIIIFKCNWWVRISSRWTHNCLKISKKWQLLLSCEAVKTTMSKMKNAFANIVYCVKFCFLDKLCHHENICFTYRYLSGQILGCGK